MTTRRGAEAMWAADAARGARHGVRVVGAGHRPVVDDGARGHGQRLGLCHGGLVAALADSAFALACNSYGDVTVAAGFDITFLEPARLGDTLVATAVERAVAAARVCTT